MAHVGMDEAQDDAGNGERGDRGDRDERSIPPRLRRVRIQVASSPSRTEGLVPENREARRAATRGRADGEPTFGLLPFAWPA
jgi:hypothetical protein